MARNSAPRGLSAVLSTVLSTVMGGLAVRHSGLQCQRMQDAAHLAAQRLIDDLMLLDAGLAAEGFRDHGCRIMVAIAGKIADRHLGVGDRCLDHLLDIAGVHRHPSLAPLALSGRPAGRPAFPTLESRGTASRDRETQT